MRGKSLNKVRSVHFIGIGGVGISALARMFLEAGGEVSGSDSSSSPITRELENMGAKIFFEHKTDNLSPWCNLVIYSNAITPDNPELLETKKRNIRTLSYPEALGEISREKFTIAVSGNAGKTSVTAMLGQILLDAKIDPTIIVGSLASFSCPRQGVIKTNYIHGRSQYMIVEADEYKRAFLNLTPKILIINNIAEDHLDYYKDLIDIQGAFRDLANKVYRNGFIVCSTKDTKVMPALTDARATILDYSGVSLSKFHPPFFGAHNKDNARVAILTASLLGIDRDLIEKSLENFKGVWRRLEYKGRTERGALVYDDYAHNPFKISALLSGLRARFPTKKIIVIFQPHLFSRLKQMLVQFAESLSLADRVIITPIYASRERFDKDINHKMLAESILGMGRITQVETLDSPEEVEIKLESEGDKSVCIFVGAGDIYKTIDNLELSKD